MQFLEDSSLNGAIAVGFTATKKIGNAVKRNKAKRLMRELARKVLIKYGKINSYYVLIAKNSIFSTPFAFTRNRVKKINFMLKKYLNNLLIMPVILIIKCISISFKSNFKN